MPSTPSTRPSRPAVARTRVVDWDRTPPPVRRPLAAQLYGIVSASLDLGTQADFERMYLAQPGVRLGLLEDEQGRPVGFCPVRRLRLDVDGRPTTVFRSGVFVRPSHRGGAAALRLAFGMAMREKIVRPLRDLFFVAPVFSPVAYRRLARTAPRLYPHPERALPEQIRRVMQAVVEHEGWAREPGWDGVVRLPLRHRRQDRSSALFRSDADVAYFEERTPGWRNGQHLVCAVRLDLSDVVRGAARAWLGCSGAPPVWSPTHAASR